MDISITKKCSTVSFCGKTPATATVPAGSREPSRVQEAGLGVGVYSKWTGKPASVNSPQLIPGTDLCFPWSRMGFFPLFYFPGVSRQASLEEAAQKGPQYLRSMVRLREVFSLSMWGSTADTDSSGTAQGSARWWTDFRTSECGLDGEGVGGTGQPGQGGQADCGDHTPSWQVSTSQWQMHPGQCFLNTESSILSSSIIVSLKHFFTSVMILSKK